MHVPPFAAIFAGIAMIIIDARLGGRLFVRLGQPAVVGEIVVGIVLGTSVLGQLPGDVTGHLFPVDTRPFLQVVAALGLALFMFIVGLELDLGVIRGQERVAAAVSLASIALPFALGLLLGFYLYAEFPPPGESQSKLAFAMFLGASMSITAFPVLARILADRSMLRTPLGATAMACAAVDDVVAWALLAVVVAIAGPGGGGHEAGWHIWLTLPYLAGMLLVVRPLLQRLVRWYHRVGRLTPDILAVLLVGLLLSAYATDWLGIHYIFGAFVFGAVMPREDSAPLVHEILERLEQVSVLLLLPVFFIVTGLGVDVTALDAGDILLLLLVLLVAVAGKFLGAYAGARLMRLPRHRAAGLAVLMNTRGLTELVILTVGREKGILDDDLFAIMVVMAIVTTVMTGPLFRVFYSDRRLARDVAEAERAALGQSRGRRVLVAVEDPADAGPLLDVGTALVTHEPDAELVLAHVQAFAGARLEVGSGIALDLASMAATSEALEALRAGVAGRGTDAAVMTRLAADPAEELASMARAADAEVVVVGGVGDTWQRLRGLLPVQLVAVEGAGPLGGVTAVAGGSPDGDAASEVALRLAAGAGVPLRLVDEPAARGARRRVGAIVTAGRQAGLDVAQAEPDERHPVLVVPVDAMVATGGSALVVTVSAEQDREPFDPAALFRALAIRR